MSSPKSPGKSPRSPQSPPGAVEAAETPAQQARDGFIQPDTDSDSAYSLSTDVTDTESLRSSILNYKWVHGRRFHAYGDGTYW
ncbi:hypothetical protein NW760_004717 [Fusarium oxysporum]|nr:hypothetical protein NW769_005914 [Fusarium oxysporum]KAJ4235186.1 hypothetical protein NW760_004717 [Fusarium oxysporum]